jgi:hypothetical protein
MTMTRTRNLQVNYLLDTNACIALIKGQPSSVRSRFKAAIATGGNGDSWQTHRRV